MPDRANVARTVFVTGATGFLGSRVIEELLADPACEVIALVRSAEGRTPLQRLESLWWGREALACELGRRVRVLEGDVTSERLGISECAYACLASEVTHIVHAAAEAGINQTKERFYEANVVGTRNVLDLAQRASAIDGRGFCRLVHVSTAYVAGTGVGSVPERPVSPHAYNSLYEESKHEAEKLLEASDASLSYAIVRPAQIVGDTRDGFISTFNTLYYPLKLYLKGRLPIIPVSARMRVNMVPVDYVARLVTAALDAPEAHRAVLHAVAPAEAQPAVGELIDAVRAWAADTLHVALPKPLFLPIPGAAWAGRRRNVRPTDQPKQKGLVANMLALAPYFAERRTYETARAQAVLPAQAPDWRAYLPVMLKYAVDAGFLNHSGRTVFEQMLVRMGSRTASLDYFDITPEGVTRRCATEVAEEVRSAARALRALGVGPQDRVALVGVNSTRYFAADAAIGLVGAVSVPLYYTTPAGEAAELVRKSGARLAFVGAPKLAAALPSLLPDIPLVSLSEEALKASGASEDALMPWRDFLMLSDEAPEGPFPYVSPSSLATIRYTSGTTGEPKGVTFDQHQLRWMGSAMPSLLDWKTRNSKLRYLSFLPMSHVVEGVLVAYAPYYILSDIELYYLADFPSLAATLPKVRPTLFFSVPRFYEKAWDQFAANPAAAAFLRLPEDGLPRRILAPVMRRVLLRKAGLGSCRQLIVGSAPMSVELMRSYRSLGIEIHNAYGVTEAPLITLSRLHENELGSVGTTLPDTEIRLDEDGSVFVRGPQVTRRYDGYEQDALDAEGWFDTGDVGGLSESGRLELRGRKKELIVTSYGKNISPQKVEVLLKDVPGVGEALLVGEGRPFCTALLWLKDDMPEVFDFEILDEGVRSMNEGLSHPEQVKRWMVLERQPTVSSGELTPNLKLRRTRVLESRPEAVDALYGRWPDLPAGTLHCGQA